jgi:2-oxoisovalerate dehydrogenase E2 component (dihydrolipoyl transacylase)
MRTKIVVPKMGMSTVEVDVTSLFVKVGQQVQIGDPVAEVESEKANFTIESEFAGKVVEVLIQVNDTIEVGDAICVIETEEV